MPKLSGRTSISSSRERSASSRYSKERVNTDSDTLRPDKIGQGVLHHFGKVVRHVMVADVMQVVVIWVLRDTLIEERPGKDILKRKSA